MRPAVLILAALAAAPALAPAASADQPPSEEAALVVGTLTGDQVNLRVGPRVDDAPVMQLEQGTVVVVVERAGEWLGVRLPAGFSACISAEYAEGMDRDHVRVTHDGVNLRRGPGLAHPPFRDQVSAGTVLPVVAREEGWIWVEAPEEVRAYVHGRYVREQGTMADRSDLVEQAREQRAKREALRTKVVEQVAQEEGADDGLRAEIASASRRLAEIRAAGGFDNAPLFELEDRLQGTLDRASGASERSRQLARTLIEDLRKEQQMRQAAADEALARKRAGLPVTSAPPAVPPPKPSLVDVVGYVRWERAPGWEGGGAFVLWAGDKPLHALRWGGGDLKTLDTGKPVRVRGKPLAARVLNLPLLEVTAAEGIPAPAPR